MEKLYIKGPGGRLSALLFTPESELRALIIICHGFRGAKENGGKIFPFARRLNNLGAGVLAFDFSGSGESEGDFSTITLTRQAADLQSVIQYARQRLPAPLILLGRSFGGSTVLAGAAGTSGIDAYVFWSTPVDVAETFGRILGADYGRMQAGEQVTLSDMGGSFTLQAELVQDFGRHNLRERAAALQGKPVMVIHGEQDEVVDPANAALLATLAGTEELVVFPGADHRFTDFTRQREDVTLEWLQKTIPSQRKSIDSLRGNNQLTFPR